MCTLPCHVVVAVAVVATEKKEEHNNLKSYIIMIS